MLVRDYMTGKVITIDADQPVRAASDLLARHRIRQVPTLRGGRLVGIVTQRDLRSAPATARTVSQVMTAKPFVIAPDAAIDEAAHLLRTYKIGALPVVEDHELVGIITISDVLDAFIALSGVAEPSYRLVVSAGNGRDPQVRVREVITEHGGEIRWMHRSQRRRPVRLDVRVKAKHIDDIVTALEAAGIEVQAVIAASSPARRRATPALRASRSG